MRRGPFPAAAALPFRQRAAASSTGSARFDQRVAVASDAPDVVMPTKHGPPWAPNAIARSFCTAVSQPALCATAPCTTGRTRPG